MELLRTSSEQLEAELGVPFGPLGRGDYMLMTKFNKGQEDQEGWHEIMDWMHQTVTQYRSAFAVALKSPTV